jgi:hypothetical protein
MPVAPYGARFVVSIETSNAAFGETAGHRSQEVARLLRKTADWLEREGANADTKRLLDANGNTVGRARFTHSVENTIRDILSIVDGDGAIVTDEALADSALKGAGYSKGLDTTVQEG